MNKKDFFIQCDKAAYGEGYSLEVSVRSDPGERYGGAIMVVLTGHLPHIGWRQLYRPGQKVCGTNWLEVLEEARGKCKQQLPKWQKWLDEWKSQFDELPIVEECECLRPRKLCFDCEEAC